MIFSRKAMQRALIIEHSNTFRHRFIFPKHKKTQNYKGNMNVISYFSTHGNGR